MLYKWEDFLLPEPQIFKIAFIFRENTGSMKNIQVLPGFVGKLLQLEGLS